MRFLLKRIMKNFPFLYEHWLAYSESLDFKYYDKHCSNYKIIPFGNYCLPRLITAINRLKPTKKYGEETFPFDLCFSDFNSNLTFFSNHFSNFYDDVEFNENIDAAVNKKCWVNSKYNLIFNHDDMPFEDFKKRYDNRIKNLYSALEKKDKYLFFLVASFKPIESEQIELFVKEIEKYRDFGTYSIIVINQSKQKVEYHKNNIYVIDLSDDETFKRINKQSNWAGELLKMKKKDAKVLNNKIYTQLLNIIKANCDF